MSITISPSILGGSFANMQETVKLIDQSKAEYIHFDVMDGDFVPNLTFGPQFISNVRQYSKKIFDVHLMINRVGKFLDEYIKVDSSTVDSALPFKEIKLGYKGLDTFLAKQFEQLENVGWGTLDFSLDNATYDAPQNDYKIEIPFEHLQYQRLINQNGGANTTIQWGWYVNDNEESYFGNPLIFYAIRQTSGTAISFRNTSNSHVSVSNYIIPSNSKAISSSTSTENIHFQLEVNEYTNDSTFTGTLFENYYKNYLTDVFNNSRRLTKVKAMLPLKIIYNLQLNDKISLNNNNYRINSITTNLTTGESSLELLNIV